MQEVEMQEVGREKERENKELHWIKKETVDLCN